MFWLVGHCGCFVSIEMIDVQQTGDVCQSLVAHYYQVRFVESGQQQTQQTNVIRR